MAVRDQIISEQREVISNLWKIVDKSGLGRAKVLDIARQVGEGGEGQAGDSKGGDFTMGCELKPDGCCIVLVECTYTGQSSCCLSILSFKTFHPYPCACSGPLGPHTYTYTHSHACMHAHPPPPPHTHTHHPYLLPLIPHQP